MAIVIGKEYKFEAAHLLPNHEGKCRNLHGHSYRVEVEIHRHDDALIMAGPSEGMVWDFATLDAHVGPIIDRLDHSYLNDTIPRGFLPPTAESIALYIAESIGDRLFEAYAENAPVELERVRVYETAKAYAEWRQSL